MCSIISWVGSLGELNSFIVMSGDPISMDLERQREWDEAVRLHVYNLESELLLHG